MVNKTPSSEIRGSNIPEMSVSELAFSLKRTLEETYGRVRVRGELSRVTIPASGHMYADIKDEKALINSVCWKGTLSKLSIKPEEGLEVICTGRISTYPARSNYQLIIESMELAGEGALLKMLEERKKKLAAEGLFAPERKKKLPFLPQRIGVVTSPTGAVIRDILHRLNDRFPRPVLLWPVMVQGEGAAAQITAAINGFSAMKENSPNLAPDLLIVARGGGSLEDLMPFNEENVVRAVAECTIPLISAVGHETDTMLIDYAADFRAPTPTGAAEISVPVRLDLLAQVTENEKRLMSSMSRKLSATGERLQLMAARMGNPQRLLEIKTQALDYLSHKMTGGFQTSLSQKQSRIIELGALLPHPKALIKEKTTRLNHRAKYLLRTLPNVLDNKKNKLKHTARMLESLSFKRVLKRGYVVVWDKEGKPLTNTEQTRTGQDVQLEFGDKKIEAVIGGREVKGATKTRAKTEAKTKNADKTEKSKEQGQLFNFTRAS